MVVDTVHTYLVRPRHALVFPRILTGLLSAFEGIRRSQDPGSVRCGQQKQRVRTPLLGSQKIRLLPRVTAAMSDKM